MSDTDKKTDDQKFNDTLKRMLKTPPKPKVSDEENKKSNNLKRPSES